LADLLVDTAILVDLLRNYEPALEWKLTRHGEIVGIVPYVFMEVMNGARDRRAQERALTFLHQFEMVYPIQDDLEWAMTQHVAHHLKFGVGVIDCLIAAPAARLGLPLYTHNLKHFTPLLGDLAQRPY